MKKIPFLIFLMPAVILADDIYLKGAGSISGRITERTETMVMIDNGDGIIGVPMDRIDRIVEGRSALDEYEARASRLKPQDAGGWRNLGRLAAEKGLSTQSREAYEKVLAVAPDDPEAREALGYVKLDGRWMTEEESYRARGYMKFQGEWMTPAEAQMVQASDAADQARREAEQRANEAEVAKLEAEVRAEEAEKRAEEAEDRYGYNDSVYWGGWGYGVNYWPTSTVNYGRTLNRPARGRR